MNAEDVARGCGGASRSGDEWTCRCPAHDDKRASLTVRDANNRLGLLVHCHAGCSQAAVLVRLNERGLLNFERAMPRSPFHLRDLGDPACVYDYRCAEGRVAFHVARYELPGRGKEIRPWRPVGTGWECKAPAAPRVLYRLRELLADPARPVLVVEGEKCADAAARALGEKFAVTTWSGGASATGKTDFSPLTGREVILWPDADEPGREVMQQIARKLANGTGANVRMLDVGERRGGWDVADALAEGWSADSIRTLIDEHAAPMSPAPQHPPAEIQAVSQESRITPASAPAMSRAVGGALGAEILDAVHAFLGRFIAYPSNETQVAHTLWIAHAHLMEVWESTPRIAFLSPEPGSGKTRALEVTETLVPRPIEAINVTPAYLFRKVADPEGAPTVLYDEIDTLFGPKAKDNEEIRGILNAGHRRGAMAGRCVVRGKIIETEELPAYCAVAIAGLGGLPDTILSRSVVVRMRRRAPEETVEPYRRRIHAPQGHALRDRLAAWATRIRESINAWPAMPDGLADRDADVWEALLAVADAAGGTWPQLTRATAVTLVTASKVATPSLGIRLLSDLRTVFGQREAMFTRDIIKELCELDEAPWADMKGKPIDARRVSRYLEAYGVARKVVRIGDQVGKGYTREALHDPWKRYLLPTSVTSVT